MKGSNGKAAETCVVVLYLLSVELTDSLNHAQIHDNYDIHSLTQDNPDMQRNITDCEGGDNYLQAQFMFCSFKAS